ncbi:IclR family transcriptional regulator [Parasedimentitalea huanghaiensis]|nr:IclR family transcriptional regulator [Zongyanglinia huanghaiensis]
MTEAKGVEAVDRALKILNCFDAGTVELSLAELSRLTGFYKSTILRIAVSLERFEFLVRGDTGLFRLGTAAGRLGAFYRQTFDLAEVVRPQLKALCDATNETASFYIREGESRICLYRAEPKRAIRHSITEGASMPLVHGASGKILLAFSGAKTKQATEIRTQGFCSSFGERDPEVAAISLPLLTRSGRLVGALAVSGLITRFSDDAQKTMLELLKTSQARLATQVLD